MRNKLSGMLPVLVFFLTISGCRTYGGHGSEQATYDRITAINTQFAQDLDRTRSELELLERAAAMDTDLNAAVSEYESLLEQHESMIEQHEEWARTLRVKTGMFGRLSTSYRDLSRMLGYITADQLSMRNQYKNFAVGLLKDDAQRARFQIEQSRYEIAPPYYEQIRFALAERSISNALDQRAGS